MKISTREDIDAPAETVYAALTNFEGFERQMLRRGIQIAHDDACLPPNVGARWSASFTWRQRQYDVEAELISVEPGVGYSIESKAGGVVCMAVADLVALSKSRTRLFASVDLKPTSLSSRLFIQSLKLTKSSLTKRFKSRVADFAKSIPVDS